LVNRYVEEQLEKEAAKKREGKSSLEKQNLDDDNDTLENEFPKYGIDSDVDTDVIPLPGQVENEQGGFSYPVKEIEHLKRFIVLGTEGRTYYAKQEERENQKIACVLSLLEKGYVDEILRILVEYSTQGRVYKEDSILCVFANCCQSKDADIRRKSYEKLCVICNIPTKLFKFIDLCQKEIGKERTSESHLGSLPERQLKKKRLSFKAEPVESMDTTGQPTAIKTKKQMEKEKRKADPFKFYNTKGARSAGWGRLRRKGVGSFYRDPSKSAERLLYLLTKYKKRNNWSHKQVLGYTHPKISVDDEEKLAKDLVLSYCTRGEAGYKKLLQKIEANNCSNQVVTRVCKHIEVLEQIAKLSPNNEGDEAQLLAILKAHGIREAADEFTSAFAFGSFTSQTSQTSFTTVNEKSYKKSPFQVVREHIPTAFLKSPKVKKYICYLIIKHLWGH
jgi:TROVE domain.